MSWNDVWKIRLIRPASGGGDQADEAVNVSDVVEKYQERSTTREKNVFPARMNDFLQLLHIKLIACRDQVFFQRESAPQSECCTSMKLPGMHRRRDGRISEKYSVWAPYYFCVV